MIESNKKYTNIYLRYIIIKYKNILSFLDIIWYNNISIRGGFLC